MWFITYQSGHHEMKISGQHSRNYYLTLLKLIIIIHIVQTQSRQLKTFLSHPNNRGIIILFLF